MELSPEERRRIYAEEKARLEAQQKIKTEQRAKAGKSAPRRWIWIIVVLCILWIIGTITQRNQEPGRNDAGARVMAESFVKDHLLAPSTADFGGESVQYLGAAKHVVVGHVDSQNAFGAKLRKRFVCTVEQVDSEKWKSYPPCGPIE
jgi:hypothetical protein